MASDLYKEAERKLSGFAFGDLFGGKSFRYHEAGELFMKAANLWRVEGEKEKCIESYERAAFCYEKSGNEYELMSCLSTLAKIKSDVELYERVVEIYSRDGKFSNAAKIQCEMAALLEGKDKMKALEAYTKAARLYSEQNQDIARNSCLAKMAELSATLEMYDAASLLFEGLATRYKVNEHLFNASLCVMYKLDNDLLEDTISRFCNEFPNFRKSQEYNQLERLLYANDQEDFRAVCVDINPTGWKVKLLQYVLESLDTDYC